MVTRVIVYTTVRSGVKSATMLIVRDYNRFCAAKVQFFFYIRKFFCIFLEKTYKKGKMVSHRHRRSKQIVSRRLRRLHRNDF